MGAGCGALRDLGVYLAVCDVYSRTMFRTSEDLNKEKSGDTEIETGNVIAIDPFHGS